MSEIYLKNTLQINFYIFLTILVLNRPSRSRRGKNHRTTPLGDSRNDCRREFLRCRLDPPPSTVPLLIIVVVIVFIPMVLFSGFFFVVVVVVPFLSPFNSMIEDAEAEEAEQEEELRSSVVSTASENRDGNWGKWTPGEVGDTGSSQR